MLWAHGSLTTNNFQGILYHGSVSRGSVGITLLGQLGASASKALQQGVNVAPGAAQSAAPRQQQQQRAEDGRARDVPAALAVQATQHTGRLVTTNPDGTLSVEMRCPRAVLPAKETTYLVCYFQAPNDQ
jgi:glucose/arabinose dehydrogenase